MPLLRSIFLRENVDLIHSHSAFASLGNEALITAGILGIRTVFTDHSLFGFSDVSAIVTNKILRFNLANVSHVICVSHTGRENTMIRSNVAPQRISVIPNAIDACSFRSDVHRGAMRFDDRLSIVVMSRLVYRKGIDLLVKIIPIVCARFPRVDFVIGGDGPKRIAIEEMRDRCSLHDRVRMLGVVHHSQVRDVMCAGHIFLNASLTEAFCIAIVEAASCGMLVVSTAVGGVPEVLPADIITLAPPTAEGIIEAIGVAIERVKDLSADSMLRQHARVTGMYDWQVVAQRTEVAYHVALKQTIPSLHERMANVCTVGPIAGPILVCFCVLLELVSFLLMWLLPRPRDVSHVSRNYQSE